MSDAWRAACASFAFVGGVMWLFAWWGVRRERMKTEALLLQWSELLMTLNARAREALKS